MEKIKLCQEGKCCPEVEIINDETVIITDDDGGKVQLTMEQLEILFERMKSRLEQSEAIFFSSVIHLCKIYLRAPRKLALDLLHCVNCGKAGAITPIGGYRLVARAIVRSGFHIYANQVPSALVQGPVTGILAIQPDDKRDADCNCPASSVPPSIHLVCIQLPDFTSSTSLNRIHAAKVSSFSFWINPEISIPNWNNLRVKHH